MLLEIRVPSLERGEGNTATVVFWQVEEGEEVVKGDALVELSAGQRTFQIPSPVSGTVYQIEVEDNEEVTVGDVLCIIEEA